MKLIRNMKLRSKMVFGFSLVMILMLAALSFGLFGLLNNSQQFADFRIIANEVKMAEKIQTELLSSRISFNNFVASGNEEMAYTFDEQYYHMEQYIADFIRLSRNNDRVQYVSTIEKELKNYNVGFKHIKELDEKSYQIYDDIVTTGTEMVDAIKHIKDIAYAEENEVILDLAANSLQYLLTARLYASKYYDFHEEENFESYIDNYVLFMEYANELRNKTEGYQYNADLNTLEKNLSIYSDEMLELSQFIKEMDQLIFEMDQIGTNVTKIIEEINNSIILEEEIYEEKIESQVTMMISAMGVIAFIALIFSVLVALGLLKLVLVPIQTLTETFKAIALGDVDLDFRLDERSKDEIGTMAGSFNQFMIKLKDIMNNVRYQNWLKTAQSDINDLLRDEEDIVTLSSKIISYLCNYIDANIGAFYLNNEDKLSMTASFAYHNRKGVPKILQPGDGLVGQAALEKKKFVITEIPDDYVAVQSGLGEAVPKNIIVLPCMYEEELMCVIEIGSLKAYTREEINLLEALANVIGISINSAKLRIQMKELLNKTLNQAEELQVQQEELRQTNEELEEQAVALKESEMRLQTQQEELKVSNEELEQHSRELELQKQELDQKNQEIIASQQLILNKAEELETINRYKSEFLANMSHELRTPLNSILILSQLLSNRDSKEPLTEKELEYATTINSSGTDLLTLINSVLDLSKVEAGRLELNHEDLNLNGILSECDKLFKPVAEVKQIEFKTELENGLPETITSDGMRLLQVIKNLISNAIKFTHTGEVVLAIKKPKMSDKNMVIDNLNDYIAIEVQDTGIGIPEDKKEVIFEAFRQSDGTTSRQYGGTGLGLTISLELAHALGGHILLDSQVGKGSTFTILIPLKLQMNQAKVKDNMDSRTIINNAINYEDLHKEEAISLSLEDRVKTLLIIEDDNNFATILADIAKDKGYKAEIALDGITGFNKAVAIQPSAIILDIGLPDINGMDLAKKLGQHKTTKDIPIHIISGSESDENSSMPKSIIGYLKKPVDIKAIYETLAKLEGLQQKGLKQLLIVGDCGGESFEYFTNMGQVELQQVTSGREGLECLKNDDYQCVVLDIKLSDMSGVDFLVQLKEELEYAVPVVIYTDEEMDDQQVDDINQYADSIILKSSKSQDRLVDEVLIFLHDINKNIEDYIAITGTDNNQVTKGLKNKIENMDIFSDKKVLLVDDDERNLFALLNVLEQYGIEVIVAKNGEDAIKSYKEFKNIDLILMDIMMPKMDGYEAIRTIRGLESANKIPIIALTAKAMKDDRDKCIKAGANDYMTKPIEIDKLISLLKVWLV
ncbi:response regulator [Vallitalea okinawensis]|uniref:response regulator n=1 Tax=Vallitalea okinawensis TaxID=2078660 RepID=UPI000CFBA0B1|nr:response regulator [Vallitalea okinawensis]